MAPPMIRKLVCAPLVLLGCSQGGDRASEASSSAAAISTLSATPPASSAPASAERPAPALPPGRSPWPKPSEWKDAETAEIKGAEKLGCAAKRVREYLKVTCAEGKDNKHPVGVVADFGVEVLTLSLRQQLTAIFPVVEGSVSWVAFLWERKEARLMVSWFPGEPRPSPLGEFDLLMERHQLEPSTVVDRRICECAAKAGLSCSDDLGVANDCLGHYGDCQKLLACARGDIAPACPSGHVPSGPDGRCHLPCDALDTCPVGARCEAKASPKYCVVDDSIIRGPLALRRDEPDLPNDGIVLPLAASTAEACPPAKEWDERATPLDFNGHTDKCRFRALNGWVELSCHGFPRFREVAGKVVVVKEKDSFFGRRCVQYGEADLRVAIGPNGFRFRIAGHKEPGRHLARMTTEAHGINGGNYLNHRITPEWAESTRP